MRYVVRSLKIWANGEVAFFIYFPPFPPFFENSLHFKPIYCECNVSFSQLSRFIVIRDVLEVTIVAKEQFLTIFGYWQISAHFGP